MIKTNHMKTGVEETPEASDTSYHRQTTMTNMVFVC